jgi:hypothetical protein
MPKAALTHRMAPRPALLCVVAALALTVAMVASALAPVAAQAADAGGSALPSAGILSGLGGQPDVASFERLTGTHPQVFQTFITWGQRNAFFITRAHQVGAKLMIALQTTASESGPELITPGQIASGQGDGYLIWLSRTLAGTGQPTIVRLMAEMNGYNSYSAFDPYTGAPRGPGHSTDDFKQAWRRVTLILRGGSVASINARLKALGMARLSGMTPDQQLPAGDVAMFFCPQVAGAPDTPANSPDAFWPGGAYVDIVGTDFYSAFPNWTGLQAMYDDPTFAGKPFGFGEWSIWKGDNPSFVHQFYAWIRSHSRVQLVVYNQGEVVNGPLALSNDPQSAAAIRAELHNA